MLDRRHAGRRGTRPEHRTFLLAGDVCPAPPATSAGTSQLRRDPWLLLRARGRTGRGKRPRSHLPPAAVTARSACSLLPTRRRLPRPGTGSPASPGPCHHGWTQRGAVQSPAVAPSAAFGPTWPSAWERHGASTRLQLRGHRAAPLLPSQVAGRVVPLGFLTGWGVSDS